jgi:hypothetical protein
VSLRGRYWLGVPDADFWLLHVGREYTRFLPEELPPANHLGGGVVIKFADAPNDWESIGRHRIRWPSEVLRRGDHLDQDRAAETIPDLTTRRSSSAS